MKLKKIYVRSTIILTTILSTVWLTIHYVLPYGIVNRKDELTDVSISEIDAEIDIAQFSSKEGYTLSGFWVYPKNYSQKAIVIFHHGIGGGKEHFYKQAEYLATKQIASVVFDARGHGESEGPYISYGFYEKYDVSEIVKEIKTKHPNLPIGIWGNSMGGAIALQALANDRNIDFGIIESTFTDLNQIVFDYQKRYSLGIGVRPICDYSLKRAGQIANFDPQSIKPIEYVKIIEQPIFLAHGTDDPNIKFEYGKALFNNLKSKDKVFYPVKGGNHYNLAEKGGEKYNEAIEKFIARQIKHFN